MKMKLTSVTLGILLSCSISVRADDFSADELNRRAMERRAVEAVIWVVAGGLRHDVPSHDARHQGWAW